MTGFVQSLRDTSMFVRTDKRVWSAGAFVTIVFFVWATTTSWRSDVEVEKEKRVRAEKPAQEHIKNEIASFQRDLEENRQTRAQFGEALKRAEGDMQASQKEMDWTLNSLVDKLDNIGNRVDQLANQIGRGKLEKGDVERRIDSHGKKKKQAVKKVDPGEL